MNFHIDREKLARALKIVKEQELHLELLLSCHPNNLPSLRMYELEKGWLVSFERYHDKISQVGSTPGEALDKLIAGALGTMEKILSDNEKKK